jgi:DNA polymerase I-like protein with 3'-5' exonuclease and polymerase domains
MSTTTTATKANTMNKKRRVTFAPEISNVIGTVISGTPTIEIMCASTNTSSPTATKETKMNKKRRVTFAPKISKVIGTVIAREDYTVVEKKRAWWSRKEASKSRDQCKRLILTVRERGQHFIKLIDDSLMVAQCLSTSLGDKEVDSLFKDPSNYTSKLEAWTLNGQGRRGLEKKISAFQRRERLAAARAIRFTILETQLMGVSSEEAAKMYAEQSLASRIYARWMGEADYRSACFC